MTNASISEEWIRSDEPERWADALAGVPHSYWHRSRPCHAAAVNAGCPVYLHVLHDGGCKLVCPIMERPWKESIDFATPIGFSGFAVSSGDEMRSDLLDRWSNALAARGGAALYLAQHPLFGPSLKQFATMRGSTLFIIDLKEPLDVWLSRIDRNRRRSIRAWQRQGSPWVLDRKQLAAFIGANHEAAMRAVNASDGSYFSHQALEILCMDPDAEIVGAADSQGICSAMVFGSSSWGAEAIFHISVRGGRQFTVALYWWAVHHYHQKVPFLNLGGSPAEDDALATAKRYYRPAEEKFHKLRVVLNEAVYQRLCRETGISPRDDSGYFPAYRRPVLTVESPHHSPEQHQKKAEVSNV